MMLLTDYYMSARFFTFSAYLFPNGTGYCPCCSHWNLHLFIFLTSGVQQSSTNSYTLRFEMSDIMLWIYRCLFAITYCKDIT